MTRFAWDADHRLRSVTAPDGAVTAYRYDPAGRRIEIAGPPGIVRFAYGAEANALVEYDGANARTARYASLLHLDTPILMQRGGAAYFYEQDALGSVTSVTDAAGAVAQRYRYGAFGQPLGASGSVANPFTYTAREYDAVSATYHLRWRQYDPAVGRFTSEDPLTAPNRYVYALDDPLGYRDPLGLQAAVEYSTLTDRQAKQTQTTSYSVYRFWDVNQRWYYGMSQNLEQRIAAHGARVTQGTVQELIKGIPERNIARAIEQQFIELAGGPGGPAGTQGPLANIINAMSRTNSANADFLPIGEEVVTNFLGVVKNFVPVPPPPIP